MSRPQSGPPLIVPAVAFTALTIAGIAAAAGVPRPDAPGTEVLAYLQDHASTMRLSAFLALGAAVPLASGARRRIGGYGRWASPRRAQRSLLPVVCSPADSGRCLA